MKCPFLFAYLVLKFMYHLSKFSDYYYLRSVHFTLCKFITSAFKKNNSVERMPGGLSRNRAGALVCVLGGTEGPRRKAGATANTSVGIE